MTEKRITNDPRQQKRPDVFMDKIVWMSNGLDAPFAWTIFLYDLKGGTEKRFIDIPMQAGSPVISGDRIAWISYTWRTGLGVYLYEINSEIMRPIPIKIPSFSNKLAISEDIVLVSSTLKNGKREIHRYDINSKQVRLLTSEAESYGDISGDQIVWTQKKSDGSLGICLYKIKSGQEQFFPLDIVSPDNPVISDEGLAWEDNCFNNITSINLYNFKTGEQKCLANKNIRQTGPVISGHRVVWIDFRRSRNGDVYTYNMKSNQEKCITEMNAFPLNVAVHGHQVVWDDKRNGPSDIYMWNATNDSSPVIDPVADKLVTEGQRLQFSVTASSSGEQDIALSAELDGGKPLEEIGANFIEQGNGIGLFEWTATDTVYGEKVRIKFRATNSSGFSGEIDVVITICLPGTIKTPLLDQPLAENVAFVWEACEGVTDYWLMLGSCPRMGDIYDNFEGQKTKVQVSNIPQDGRTVYVTLKSRMNGNWINKQYAYQSLKKQEKPAELTQPLPKTNLSETELFQWDLGKNVLFYELLVGSCPRKGDIYEKVFQTSTPFSVSHIPQDGRTVHVTLKSLIHNEWILKEYIYKTKESLHPAELIKPKDGSILSEKADFEWNPGENVSAYWLKVGTNEFDADIDDQFKNKDTQASVDKIPQNGQIIFVTLSSLIYGKWRNSIYTFKTNSGAVVAAELIKPVLGTVITSEKVQFEWTSGENVTRYWLLIGTSEGRGDIFDQSQGENLSTIVSGIPLYGEKIHVTLRSKIDGIWHDQLYDYATKVPQPPWRKIYKFLSSNRTPADQSDKRFGGMPLSYKIAPHDYWQHVDYPPDQPINDNRSIIERLIIKHSVNIYDAATGQIAEMILGDSTLADLQTQRLLSGKSGDLNYIRTNNPQRLNDFIYNGKKVVLKDKASVNPENELHGDNTWFFRTISDKYLQSDPLDGKVSYPGFPEFNSLHHVDWKPIAGEQAWATMIGPLQLVYHRLKNEDPLETPEVKLALSILPAIDAMQSPIGGILHAPLGTAGKDPRDISNENNESLFSGLKMLLAILEPHSANQEINENIATIRKILFGENASHDGIEGYFKKYMFNKATGVFDQGGFYIDDSNDQNYPFRPNTILAVDVQTWGVLVLGVEKIDEWFGQGTAFRIWENTKIRSGFYDQKGVLRGVGYTDQHEVSSAEWGLGAVMMTKALYRHYQKSDTKEAQEWAKESLSDSIMMRQGIEEMKVVMEDDGGTAYKYANIRYKIPFSWWANPIPSLASTAWIVMADREFNPFKLGGGSYYT